MNQEDGGTKMLEFETLLYVIRTYYCDNLPAQCSFWKNESSNHIQSTTIPHTAAIHVQRFTISQGSKGSTHHDDGNLPLDQYLLVSRPSRFTARCAPPLMNHSWRLEDSFLESPSILKKGLPFSLKQKHDVITNP